MSKCILFKLDKCMLFSKSAPVVQWYSITFASQRTLVRACSIKTFFSHFCIILGEFRVRIKVKIVSFPAAFSGYGTSFALPSLSSYAMSLKGECRTVPEQGQNLILLYFYYIQKRKKLNFFHILRVNSKISLKGPILIH